MSSFRPLPVVVAAVRSEHGILLLKREKPPYEGYLALPGGKIEFGEHPSVAVRREVLEETGMNRVFDIYDTIEEAVKFKM